jgi:hypothetical protein
MKEKLLVGHMHLERSAGVMGMSANPEEIAEAYSYRESHATARIIAATAGGLPV